MTMNVVSTKAKLVALTMAMAAAAFVWTGCDSDDEESHGHTPAADGGHSSPFPACKAITSACHEVDTGEDGAIHECHDKAHGAKSDSDCTGIKDNCLKICAEAKADAGEDHDGGDGGH
jgi:hypothetical protein